MALRTVERQWLVAWQLVTLHFLRRDPSSALLRRGLWCFCNVANASLVSIVWWWGGGGSVASEGVAVCLAPSDPPISAQLVAMLVWLAGG